MERIKTIQVTRIISSRPQDNYQAKKQNQYKNDNKKEPSFGMKINKGWIAGIAFTLVTLGGLGAAMLSDSIKKDKNERFNIVLDSIHNNPKLQDTEKLNIKTHMKNLFRFRSKQEAIEYGIEKLDSIAKAAK